MTSDKKHITTPLTEEVVRNLRAGDAVLLSGKIYTARDLAHRRLVESLERGEKLPFQIQGAVVYYVGPSPAKPGKPIGACGPTTSYRMDPYTPKLLSVGLKGMIGKGNRSPAVIEALKQYCAVYFAAVGGAAALLAQRVKQATPVAYEDLGPEAVQELLVEDLPLIVVNDCYGGDLYEEGVRRFRKEG
ncbi:MAG: Fe-S-containing hydro-lyase [candidate division WOR-3 bacterium]|jgi:fumarate hydratase subunit beta|nr:Fe-S-containing hydro-lyase [candidate division WOR-3 bacterium]MCR4424263.1 Fe-S-containing hydro-lyase [candidate division WOR-3 bacterium]MDH7519757.1 Fe-S-containing hydro-lyase [bacterium]